MEFENETDDSWYEFDVDEDEINDVFDDYKLAFMPNVIDKLDESIFDRDEFAYTEIESIYFLTDDEEWFDQDLIEEYTDAYNIVLIVIKDNNSIMINYINDNQKYNYDYPWYEFLSNVYHKSKDMLFCNKKYSYFDEQMKFKKEHESKPVTKDNLDQFLKELDDESNN